MRNVVFVRGGESGPTVEDAVPRVLAAAGAEIEWQFVAAEADAATAIRAAGMALKPHLPTVMVKGKPINPNVQLRRELGLFASVRPLHNLAGLPARFAGVDILLIREITEDLYSAIEHEVVPGVVQSIKVVTEAASLRFLRFAFELIRSQGRKSVHCIHKANILKQADGLFLNCFRRVAAEFPEVTPKELIVDNACMQLVSRPRQFEAMVAGNLYGDLLSDLGAGLVGGAVTATGINHGDGVRVYEAIHGRADGENPLSLLCPAMELLRDLGQPAAADRVRAAVERVLTDKRTVTPDLGGTASGEAMAEAIAAAVR